MQLRDLQSGFKNALLALGQSDFAARAILGGDISPSARLQIHRNNMVITLSEALKAVYPAIARLVGCEFFDALASSFIRSRPPARGSLINYGGDFASFLDDFEPAQQLPYLSDMARLEWAWHEAFHSADSPPITGTILAEFESEQLSELRFRLLPSVRLVTSTLPIGKLWEVTQAEEEPEGTIEIEPGASHLLVYRPKMDVHILFLDSAAFDFLQSISQEQSLTQAYETACEIDPDFDLQSSLAELMAAGVFAAVRAQA